MESSNKPTWRPPDGVPKVVHVILRMTAVDISDEFLVWTRENTTNFLVAEHNADLEEKRTHCHMSLVELKVTIEGLRKQIKALPLYKPKCYTIMLKTEKTRELYDELLLDEYILKGGVDSTLVRTTQTKEYQQERLAKWVNHKDKPDKEENAKTIYDICSKVFDKGYKEVKLDNHNALVPHFLPNMDNWLLMCKELNLAKIRTSRNELERAWVTILRQDTFNQQELFYSIQSSVFRNKT